MPSLTDNLLFSKHNTFDVLCCVCVCTCVLRRKQAICHLDGRAGRNILHQIIYASWDLLTANGDFSVMKACKHKQYHCLIFLSLILFFSLGSYVWEGDSNQKLVGVGEILEGKTCTENESYRTRLLFASLAQCKSVKPGCTLKWNEESQQGLE